MIAFGPYAAPDIVWALLLVDGALLIACWIAWARLGQARSTFYGWFALMAPAGTPKELTARMYADLEKATAEPGMQRYLATQGMTRTLTPKGQLRDEIAQEFGRWKPLVAKRKISAN